MTAAPWFVKREKTGRYKVCKRRSADTYVDSWHGTYEDAERRRDELNAEWRKTAS